MIFSRNFANFIARGLYKCRKSSSRPCALITTQQRHDVLSAIAEKDAALAAAEASRPAVGVPNAEKDAALAAAQASRPPVGVPRARPAAAPAKPGAAPAEKRGSPRILSI